MRAWNDGALKRDPADHPGGMDKRLPENLGPPGTGKSKCKVNLPHFLNASVQKPCEEFTELTKETKFSLK